MDTVPDASGVPRITAEMLTGARNHGQEIFAAQWPDGMEVTPANVHRLQLLGIDLNWASRLFTPEAQVTYYAATDSAEAAYRVHAAVANLQRHKAITLAKRVYDESVDMAEQAYNAAVRPAERILVDALVQAWVDAYVASVKAS